MNPGACILDAFAHRISVCMILFVVIKVIAEKVEIRLPFLGAGYHKFAQRGAALRHLFPAPSSVPALDPT
jgi:hypothetical protein